MKRCPRCSQTYTDDGLNFCLNDGEYLTSFDNNPPPARFADDSPPTIAMDPARITSPTNWPPVSSPPTQWQQPQPLGQQQMYVPYGASPSQTLAVVSLCLGIGSLTIGWCCSLGLLLSPAALITGFIALSQTKNNPQQYGGRGFAIGGIATGGVFIALYVILIIIYGAAIFLGGLR